MSTVPYFRSQKYSELRLKVPNIVMLESRLRQCKAEVALQNVSGWRAEQE